MRRSNECLNPSAFEISLSKCPGVRLVGFAVADSNLAKTASDFFTSGIACLFYGCYVFPFDGSRYFLTMDTPRLTIPVDQKIASERELEKKGVNPEPPVKYLLHFGSGQAK